MTSPSDAASERPRRLRWLELGGWIALWLVARGALVLALADVFFYGEELEKACAGKAMLDGLGVPHHQLAYHYYEGGGFVVSHLDALAFLVFGESLLAVKLVALGLGASVLAAGWALTERFGGRVASRAFGLLFVLAPIGVQHNSLLALGIHFHAMLFVALVLLFAGRVLFEGDRRPRTWFLLGLGSGFGLYFSYQLALTLAVVAVALVWRLRPELRTRSALAGVAGLVIGLLPLAWMAANVGGEIFDIHGGSLSPALANKLATLRQFCASFGTWWWVGAVTATLSFVLAAWSALRAPATRGIAILVLSSLAVFAAAYLLSSFTVGRVIHYFPLHRLVPGWFLAIAVGALGAAAAWRSGRRVARIGVVLLVGANTLIGAAFASIMVAKAATTDWSVLARTKGYAYAEYIGKVQHHLPGERVGKLQTFLRFDESSPELLQAALAENLYRDGTLSIEEVRAELRGAGVENERGFLLGLGYGLRERHLREGGAKDDIAGRAAWLRSQPGGDDPALREALGRFGLGLLNTRDRLQKEIRAGPLAALGEEYFVGVGYRAWNARGDLREGYFGEFSPPHALSQPDWFYLAPLTVPLVTELLTRGYEHAMRDRSLD